MDKDLIGTLVKILAQCDTLAWVRAVVVVAKIHASSKDPDYDCIIINPKTNIQIKHLLRYYRVFERKT